MKELIDYAETIGVSIRGMPAGGGRPKGLWWPDRRLIFIRADLGHVRARSTLAHELGHATRGDYRSDLDHYDSRAERLADQWAANRLITPEAYAAAEVLHGPEPGAIAAELRVTRHTLGVWLAMHGQVDGPARCRVT